MVGVAVRILQAVGARPRRTIRMALWDGEEPSEEYAGSPGCVRRHFGDPGTMRLEPFRANLVVGDYLIEDDLEPAALVVASLPEAPR